MAAMKSLLSIVVALSLFSLFEFGGVAVAADAKNISIDEAAKLLKSDTNIVVLDVRTPREFQAGHIKGATNINFNDKDFAKRVAALDKDKTYIIHCAAGGRSGKACEQIKTMDFKHMLHMNQGFNAWKEEGKPIEK
jgi:rhodanese-related sulfurtransferase